MKDIMAFGVPHRLDLHSFAKDGLFFHLLYNPPFGESCFLCFNGPRANPRSGLVAGLENQQDSHRFAVHFLFF